MVSKDVAAVVIGMVVDEGFEHFEEAGSGGEHEEVGAGSTR